MPGQLSEVQKNYSRTLMNYGRNGLRKHRERDAIKMFSNRKMMVLLAAGSTEQSAPCDAVSVYGIRHGGIQQATKETVRGEQRDADRQHRIFKPPKADGSVDSGRYACDLPWRGGVECAKEAK